MTYGHGYCSPEDAEHRRRKDEEARELGFRDNEQYEMWKLWQRTEFTPDKYVGLTRKILDAKEAQK